MLLLRPNFRRVRLDQLELAWMQSCFMALKRDQPDHLLREHSRRLFWQIAMVFLLILDLDLHYLLERWHRKVLWLVVLLLILLLVLRRRIDHWQALVVLSSMLRVLRMLVDSDHCLAWQTVLLLLEQKKLVNRRLVSHFHHHFLRGTNRYHLRLHFLQRVLRFRKDLVIEHHLLLLRQLVRIDRPVFVLLIHLGRRIGLRVPHCYFRSFLSFFNI